MRDVEEADLETLLAFYYFEEGTPTEKVINGQVYKLASNAPAFF